MRPANKFAFALAFAGALFSVQPVSAGTPEDKFQEGTAAFSDGRLQEALDIFQALWKANKSYDLAVMLGRTERNLNKHKDAAEHYSYALAHFPVTGETELREEVVSELAEVKKQIGTVRITVPLKEASVKVNDVALSADALDKDVFLAPGKNVIEASAPGYQSSRRTIEIKAGETQDLTITLNKEGDAPRSRVPAFVVGGIGVAGIVAGAVLVGAAEGKKGEAIKLHDEIGSSAGCAADPVKCKALRDASGQTDALGNGGVAAFVLGGLAIAGAFGYTLLPTRRSEPKTPAPKVAVLPIASQNMGGLLISGSF
ncbi:MAG: PEGA domain-containing protein [Polyangiaceae bacterium]|nr:PEGA domain-containing protein [Polyangiaceae bacterium]